MYQVKRNLKKDGPTCKVCGMTGHQDSECFVAHPEKATDFWRQKEENQEKVRKYKEKKAADKDKGSKKDSMKDEKPKGRNMMIRGLAHRVCLSRTESIAIQARPGPTLMQTL